MREYIIYRHGYNDSNQAPDRGLPEKMPVLRLQATSPEEACRLAADQVTLHEGQTLSAEPAAEVDAKVNGMAMTAEALERTSNPS